MSPWWLLAAGGVGFVLGCLFCAWSATRALGNVIW
jgi:phosphate/sulfate permease